MSVPDYSIAPGYLKSAGTRLLVGRDVRLEDNLQPPRVAIVNLTFARRVIGTVEAVGKHFRVGSSPTLTEVIGIVEDGKYRALPRTQTPAVFFPIIQMPNSTTVLVVRCVGVHPSLPAEIRNVVQDEDPVMPVYSLGPWEEMLGFDLFPARAATVALTAFGVLGLLLAVTGVYGLAAYAVAQRRRELGVRLALGAQKARLLKAELQRGLVLLASGSAVGLLLDIAASKVLAHVVFEASADDPDVLISVAVTMIMVGLVATVLPARRAMQVDPMVVLRYE